MATTKTATKVALREGKSKVPVTELNLRKAATRLLRSALVSTEVAYIQRELGSSATQEDLDAKVLAVRAMPWASIVIAD
jgi:hypothetical protein